MPFESQLALKAETIQRIVMNPAIPNKLREARIRILGVGRNLGGRLQVGYRKTPWNQRRIRPKVKTAPFITSTQMRNHVVVHL